MKMIIGFLSITKCDKILKEMRFGIMKTERN